MPDLTDEEIIQRVHQNEYMYFYPTYEEDLPDVNSSWTYIAGNPTSRVLITAPHAQSHYRHYGDYNYACGISHEQCLTNIGWPDEPPSNNANYGHDGGCCGKEPDHYTGGLGMTIQEMTGAHFLYTQHKADDPNYYDTLTNPQSPLLSTGLIPFKTKLNQILIDNPQIKFVMDLHGADYNRPFEIDLGTGYGGSLLTGNGQVLPDLIRDRCGVYGIPNHQSCYGNNCWGDPDSCSNCGITEDLMFPGWSQDTVIKFASGNTGNLTNTVPRDAIQFEINEVYRTHYNNEWDNPGKYYSPWGSGEPWNSYTVKMVRTLADIVLSVDALWDVSTTGDINLDQQVNIQDVVLLFNYILGNFEGQAASQNMTVEEYFEAVGLDFNALDVNQDGIVNILDIVEVLNIIFGSVRSNLSETERRQLFQLKKQLKDRKITVQKKKLKGKLKTRERFEIYKNRKKNDV